MKKWTLYKHTTPSGKVYIGITSKKPKERWNSGYGYKKSKAFWNAIVKYGWSNIKHEILYENLEQSEADRLERELIAFYKSTDSRYGYNIATGGCVNLGMTAWNKGLPKKLQPQYGKTKPTNVCEKISKSLSKPIVCVETDVIFASAQLASKMLQIQYSNISRCLHGKGHTAGGYHWRWLNEN